MAFTCCRCGYQTPNKTSMKHHLFNRKTECDATHHEIELTEDIKYHILNNKQFIVTEQEFKECNECPHNRIVFITRKYLTLYECALIEQNASDTLERYYGLIKSYSIQPFVRLTNVDDIDHYLGLYENATSHNSIQHILVQDKNSWDIAISIVNHLNGSDNSMTYD